MIIHCIIRFSTYLDALAMPFVFEFNLLATLIQTSDILDILVYLLITFYPHHYSDSSSCLSINRQLNRRLQVKAIKRELAKYHSHLYQLCSQILLHYLHLIQYSICTSFLRAFCCWQNFQYIYSFSCIMNNYRLIIILHLLHSLKKCRTFSILRNRNTLEWRAILEEHSNLTTPEKANPLYHLIVTVKALIITTVLVRVFIKIGSVVQQPEFVWSVV